MKDPTANIAMKTDEHRINYPSREKIPFSWPGGNGNQILVILRVPNLGFETTKKVVPGVGSRQPNSEEAKILVNR